MSDFPGWPTLTGHLGSANEDNAMTFSRTPVEGRWLVGAFDSNGAWHIARVVSTQSSNVLWQQGITNYTPYSLNGSFGLVEASAGTSWSGSWVNETWSVSAVAEFDVPGLDRIPTVLERKYIYNAQQGMSLQFDTVTTDWTWLFAWGGLYGVSARPSGAWASMRLPGGRFAWSTYTRAFIGVGLVPPGVKPRLVATKSTTYGGQLGGLLAVA